VIKGNLEKIDLEKEISKKNEEIDKKAEVTIKFAEDHEFDVD
jgi:hypothetical protein